MPHIESPYHQYILATRVLWHQIQTIGCMCNLCQKIVSNSLQGLLCLIYDPLRIIILNKLVEYDSKLAIHHVKYFLSCSAYILGIQYYTGRLCTFLPLLGI